MLVFSWSLWHKLIGHRLVFLSMDLNAWIYIMQAVLKEKFQVIVIYYY